MDATRPLTINWLFTSFAAQNPQPLYTVDDPRVTEMRLDDNITVISFFTINSVMPDNGGVYGCLVSMTPVVIANATVNVLCKYYVSNVPISVLPHVPVPPAAKGGDLTINCLSPAPLE